MGELDFCGVLTEIFTRNRSARNEMAPACTTLGIGRSRAPRQASLRTPRPVLGSLLLHVTASLLWIDARPRKRAAGSQAPISMTTEKTPAGRKWTVRLVDPERDRLLKVST
jgi:hypothetical protein